MPYRIETLVRTGWQDLGRWVWQIRYDGLPVDSGYATPVYQSVLERELETLLGADVVVMRVRGGRVFFLYAAVAPSGTSTAPTGTGAPSGTSGTAPMTGTEYTGTEAPAETDWTPLDLATCEFWVRSDLGVTLDGGGRAEQWDDQSGNARHEAQSSELKRPLLVPDAINGRSALRFLKARADVLYPLAAWTKNWLCPMTAFCVFNWTDLAYTDTIFDSASATSKFSVWANGVASDVFMRVKTYNGSVGLDSDWNDGWRAAVFVFNGAGVSTYCYNRGLLVESVGTGTAANPVGGLFMGADSFGTPATVDFAEFALWNYELSAPDIALLGSYANFMYGPGVWNPIV